MLNKILSVLNRFSIGKNETVRPSEPLTEEQKQAYDDLFVQLSSKIENKFDLNISEAQVTKLNPQPGEVLMFEFTGDQFADVEFEVHSQTMKVLSRVFPNNKVIVTMMEADAKLKVTAVQSGEIHKPDENVIK